MDDSIVGALAPLSHEQLFTQHIPVILPWFDQLNALAARGHTQHQQLQQMIARWTLEERASYYNLWYAILLHWILRSNIENLQHHQEIFAPSQMAHLQSNVNKLIQAYPKLLPRNYHPIVSTFFEPTSPLFIPIIDNPNGPQRANFPRGQFAGEFDPARYPVGVSAVDSIDFDHVTNGSALLTGIHDVAHGIHSRNAITALATYGITFQDVRRAHKQIHDALDRQDDIAGLHAYETAIHDSHPRYRATIFKWVAGGLPMALTSQSLNKRNAAFADRLGLDPSEGKLFFAEPVRFALCYLKGLTTDYERGLPTEVKHLVLSAWREDPNFSSERDQNRQVCDRINALLGDRQGAIVQFNPTTTAIDLLSQDVVRKARRDHADYIDNLVQKHFTTPSQ